MMYCYETLRIKDYLKHLLKNDACFYFQKGFTVTFVEKYLIKYSLCTNRLIKVRQFGWGDTKHIGDALRGASENAQNMTNLIMDRFNGNRYVPRKLFGIDFLLVLEKYILSQVLFRKYFFYELLLKYVQENPHENITIITNDVFLYCYRQDLKAIQGVTYRIPWVNTGYLMMLMIIPVVFVYYCLRSLRNGNNEFNDQIVYILTSPQEYDCYKDLMGNVKNVAYITTDTYKDYFNVDKLRINNIKVVRLSFHIYKDILFGFFSFYRWLLMCAISLRGLGMHLALLLMTVVEGRSQAPAGSNNIYVAFEHHDLAKTIRNEFLKTGNNKIVFFSYSPPTILRHYPEEFYENYDFICSPGVYYEDELLLNKARINTVLKTGSYTTHKNISTLRQGNNRIKELLMFKGNNLAITILCPGVCKPTYYSEIKLIELARQIADETCARVFIRQKPFTPEPEYQGFYESYTNGHRSMHLTGMECELFDFVPVTDLFITTYSTSACEVAMCGGSIFFVDYMKHPDRFIFWDKKYSEGILLDGDEAFEKIAAWINDKTDGPVRTAHKKAMERFVEYLGYSFPDYDSYKMNLLEQLEKNVFKDLWPAKRT